MSQETRDLGVQGERIVQAHLERLGCEVLVRNFRCPGGEIDLIAREPLRLGGALLFIEVKTRHGITYGSPAESVDRRKQRRILEAARSYLGSMQSGPEEPHCRFDVAEVQVGADGLAVVNLIQGAFTG